ncbi:hypothetical protein ROS9278_03772 [Roseomonas sp. CECT 9278]|nr:hypothetical protein ROS9278_03772 [Roseomonas sp. CECT 9278]
MMRMVALRDATARRIGAVGGGMAMVPPACGDHGAGIAIAGGAPGRIARAAGGGIMPPRGAPATAARGATCRRGTVSAPRPDIAA